MFKSGDEYVENSSRLAVSVPINLYIKSVFVSVNGFRESYFVGAIRRFSLNKTESLFEAEFQNFKHY